MATMLEERRPIAVSVSAPADVGTCRSVTVTEVRGWLWDTPRMLGQMTSSTPQI